MLASRGDGLALGLKKSPALAPRSVGPGGPSPAPPAPRCAARPRCWGSGPGQVVAGTGTGREERAAHRGGGGCATAGKQGASCLCHRTDGKRRGSFGGFEIRTTAFIPREGGETCDPALLKNMSKKICGIIPKCTVLRCKFFCSLYGAWRKKVRARRYRKIWQIRCQIHRRNQKRVESKQWTVNLRGGRNCSKVKQPSITSQLN